jgi:ribosomal protein L40E
MVHLDGNAIGGELLEIFGVDMTVSTAVCRACGASGPVAEAVVYLRAPGTVVRCRACSSVLLRIVRSPGRTWIDLGGVRTLELRE